MRRRIVSALLITGLLALSACAATLRPQSRTAYVSLPSQGSAERGLPAQDLPPGDCGVFLFTREASPVFVLFDHLDAGLIRLWFEDEIRHITTDPRRDPPGRATEYLRRVMIDGQPILFSGEMEAPDGSGAAIPAAVMRRTLSNGSEAVVPLSGVWLCQPAQN
ncbi:MULTISPECIES: hypothetical protein [Hyphobacterium]|uniref:DUF2846 domain-containing protein n=1 Tax=Hyphobacterium vulgare TaxID=1736751 RepID=A0ABV6ZVB6_9PROT